MSLEIKFDDKTKPGDDFYNWVNKDWIDKTKIPEGYSTWGNFAELNEINLQRIHEIVQQTYSNDSDYNNISILYKQGMDFEKRKNINDIFNYINEIQSMRNIDSLMKLVVQYQFSWGISSPISLSIYNDFNDSKNNILHLFTGGLGLPDRDYYFLSNKENIRQEYKKFLKNVNNYFSLSMNTDLIYKIEELLAEKTHTKTEMRDPNILNNPTTLGEIMAKYKNFDFIRYFFQYNNINPGKINISNPTFCQHLDKLLDEYSLEVWRDYFCMRFILSVKNYLSIDFETICFNFYQKVLLGVNDMKPLFKRVINTVESQFGELIGQIYVNKYFSERAKTKALEMIKYLKDELRNKIINLEWMESRTKRHALDKLDTMNIKIGYPNKWRDFSKHKLYMNNSFLKNNLICNMEDNLYRLNKLYKPIDRTEWFMNPQDVNAYYSPSFNEIVFPAGILQPPFFSEDYDMALNLGGIGCVIGHEMTHGFDDKGCLYDAEGNLNDWWTEQDKQSYKEKIQVLKNQFKSYSINNTFVNSELTAGENIADLGGVIIALDGLKKYLIKNPQENVKIEGFSPIQRFFINNAKIWRFVATPEAINERLLTDPHSPPEFRVNGVVKNIYDFYIEFNVGEINKLYLDRFNRAHIW